jgi:diguanylate cyclase (GGDEF)-like protein/PAS domain S-box-containing protein
MTWNYTVYAAILHISAVVTALVGFMALRRRNSSGAGVIAILMFVLTEWAFTSGLEAAVEGIQYKIFWSKLEYLGVLCAPTLFLIFTLQYSQKNHWLKPINYALLSIVPIAGFIVTITNELHHLVWTSYSFSPILTNVLVYGHGIGYFILVVYSYSIFIAGIYSLFSDFNRTKEPYRSEISILLLGSLFPFLGGIVYSVFPKFLQGLDLPPISFSITGIVIAVGIFRFHIFDLAPLARHVIIENLDDGILVLDTQNRVVDINRVAQSILNTSPIQSQGQPISKVLKFWPGLVKRLNENEDKSETEVRWGTNPPRYFHLSVSPLYGQHKQLAGRLIILRDISNRHQTEAELAHTIKELGIINQISLAVTSGLDMENVLKTLYEQCSQLVPIDIFYVALFDETNSLIQVPIFYEAGQYQAGPSRDIEDRPGTLGAVIRSRKTLYLNNINNENVLSDTHPQQLSADAPEKTSRSYIGIPLTLRERVIGVLSIQNYRADAYTEDHIRLLERISVQAAIAIENARLYSEIQRLAIVDELTGIYNYRGLQELGAREVERANRFSRPLSVLFFDIDNFRNFNNTYNHATGNLILKAISDRCRSILRTVDVLARFGGDEFIALLPETDISSAHIVARRMVEEIATSKIKTSFGDLSVTISIGVTVLSEERPNLSALIDRANSAEHKAKQGQKGIVIVAP